MKQPITMKLIAFHVMKAFSFNQKKFTLGPCTSESLLLMFAGKGVQSEVLIPINGDGNLSRDIKVEVTNDPDVEGLVWVRLLTMAGVPLSVQIGNNFVWETGLPFSLN